MSVLKKRAEPKFHREQAAVRREALIESTLRCLKRHGHDGVSVRRISAEAGVSIGLINHHFPNKTALVADAYETLARSLRESVQREADNAKATPRHRLSGFFGGSFSPPLVDPEMFHVWVVFWGMAAHEPEIQAVHEGSYREYGRVVESLLEGLMSSGAAPAFRLREAAIGLSALLDGLWVELSLSHSAFRPAEAIALCEDWVDALCAGALRNLRRA